jgi:hypothetical protein
MIRIIFLVLFFVITLESLGQKKPFVGFSSFAAMHPDYPCNQFLRIAKNSAKPAMTVLLKTFGNDTSCIAKFLEQSKNKPHLLQIHLSNETCRRYRGRCTRDEIRANLGVREYNLSLERGEERSRVLIQSRVNLVARTIFPLTNEKTLVMLTTGLEDNYTFKAYLNVQRWIKVAGYRGYLVRNPLSDFCTRDTGAHLCELHSAISQFNFTPCIFNVDGNIVSTTRQLELFRKFSFCHALFAWEPVSQGRGVSGGYTEPKSRSFIISNSTVNEYSKLLNDYEKKR